MYVYIYIYIYTCIYTLYYTTIRQVHEQSSEPRRRRCGADEREDLPEGHVDK